MQNRIIIGVLAVLAGCAPYSGFYREGQTVARLNADQTACEARGARDVPPNTQIRTTPVQVIPGKRVCTAEGDCVTGVSRVIGGEVFSYDANADLRARVVAQCMAGKGYDRVKIPRCSPDVADKARDLAPATLPRLDGSVCAARTGAGRYVFVSAVTP